jgi:hypothetical protein
MRSACADATTFRDGEEVRNCETSCCYGCNTSLNRPRLVERTLRIGLVDPKARLRPQQADLTPLCGMLMDAGLISLVEQGCSVSFEPTAAGAAQASL